MKHEINQEAVNGKQRYECPAAKVSVFFSKDIITVSETKDENQGEWDGNL